MSKAEKRKVSVEKTAHGEFYILPNGRKIPVPPEGGRVSRGDMREALRTVISQRKKANVG